METASQYLARIGAKGGKARAQKMSAAERKASAQKAIEARWAKERERVNEITERTKALLKRSKAAAARAKQKKEKTA